MTELSQVLLIVLMIVCAFEFFIAGTAMMLIRPARIDPDTGEASYVWKACCLLMFVLSAANVRGVFAVQVNSIESWWGVGMRTLVAMAGVYVLWAINHRRRAIARGRRAP